MFMQNFMNFGGPSLSTAPTAASDPKTGAERNVVTGYIKPEGV